MTASETPMCDEDPTMPTFPPGAHQKGSKIAAAVLAQQAKDFYKQISPVVMDLCNQGLSLRDIAQELDERGIRPRRARTWSAAQVRRVIFRATGKPVDAKRASSPASATPSPANPAPPATNPTSAAPSKTSTPASDASVEVW